MKKLLLAGLAVVLVAVVWTDSVPAPLIRDMGIHNDKTMVDADNKAEQSRDTVKEDVKAAIESGKNVVEAVKQLQNPAPLGTLDGPMATYIASIEKVGHSRQDYAERIDTLDEEVASERDRWNEVIEKMNVPELKAEHQKKMEHRMQSLHRKLQAAKNSLAVIDQGLNQAANARLAIESLRHDALASTLASKLDTFIGEMKDADKGLKQALASISSSFEPVLQAGL
jgi:hypothetical protein